MSLYIADDGSGNSRLLTINLFEKRIAMNRRLQDMCTPDPEWGLLEPDWIGVSPKGSYAVVQWVKDGTAKDNAGNSDGIGSRYFTIRN
jgi:hypothetical protein